MSYNFDKDQNHYFFKNKRSIPLVFIHGVGLNQSMWQPQINYFKDDNDLMWPGFILQHPPKIFAPFSLMLFAKL